MKYTKPEIKIDRADVESSLLAATVLPDGDNNKGDYSSGDPILSKPHMNSVWDEEPEDDDDMI